MEKRGEVFWGVRQKVESPKMESSTEELPEAKEGSRGAVDKSLSTMHFHGWQSGVLEERSQSLGNTVVSVIMLSSNHTFYKIMGGKAKKGGIMWKKALAGLKGAVREGGEVRWWGHSTLGNQLRADYVFSDEVQARVFYTKALKLTCGLPTDVTKKVFLMTEAKYGVGLQPDLREEDILAMNLQCQNLFRHFLVARTKCVEDGENVKIQFHSLPDLNLFIFNKTCSDCESRSLGQLRESCQQLRPVLKPHSDGRFRLFTADRLLHTRSGAAIVSLESHDSGLRHFLCFPSKLEMIQFMLSDEGIQMEHLVIDPRQVSFREDESQLHGNWQKEQNACIEENIKINMALSKQKDEAEMLSRDIEKMKVQLSSEVADLKTAEMRVMRGRKVSLEQLLRMKFQAETVSCPYPVKLQDFLSCPAITAVVQEEGKIFFCFKDDLSLDRQLVRKLTSRCICELAESGLAGKKRATITEVLGEYELQVHLQVAGFKKSPALKNIRRIKEELEEAGAITSPELYGFRAGFPDLLGLMQCLVNRQLSIHHHIVTISQANLNFYGPEGITFNGFPCLDEHMLVRLASLEENRNISSILKNTRIERVVMDWNMQLVAVFSSTGELEKILEQYGTTREELAKEQPALTFKAKDGYWLVECEDCSEYVEDFRQHDRECIVWGKGLVASKDKGFLGRVLGDRQLQGAHPQLSISRECIRMAGV